MSTLEPGAVVAGRYRIEALLGEGGMGRVHLARHVELGERVALKVLRRDRPLGPDAEERLRREAKAVARMRGENIAKVTDAGLDPVAGPFIVMEHVAGRSLGELLETDAPLGVERVADWGIQICVALAEAHGLGIVHRDIKPSNLRLTTRPDGSPLVKVLDFGIAKVDHLAVHTLTETASMLGSPHYMSPEQLREAREVDTRTDLWSLGVVLYELSTGRRPFEAFTMAGVVSAIAADEPVSPREHREELPEGLANTVLRMLAKDPDRRFASAVDVAEALAPFGSSDAHALVGRAKAIAAAPRGWTDPPPAAPPSTPIEESIATVAATATEHAVRTPAAPARPRLPFAAAALAALALGAFGVSRIPATRSATAAPPALPATPGPEATAVVPTSSAAAPSTHPPPMAEPTESAVPTTSQPAPRAQPNRAPAHSAHAPAAKPSAAPAPPPDEFDFGTRR
ncbi:MAG: protein kinase [Polyangiaceae bacterium]